MFISIISIVIIIINVIIIIIIIIIELPKLAAHLPPGDVAQADLGGGGIKYC